MIHSFPPFPLPQADMAETMNVARKSTSARKGFTKILADDEVPVRSQQPKL